MPIEIKIIGDTAAETLHELATFAGGLSKRHVPPCDTSEEPILDGAPTPPVEPVKTAAQTLDLTEAPKRERGKPSNGRARRTKEEIAEDEAADAADAASGTSANVSTNEERVDPADVAAQDAQDEAEEVATTAAADTFTNDDLKAEMTAYVQKYGMPAVQEDGPRIYAAALGAPPAGEPAWKLSLVGDDQNKLQAAVAAWREAIAKNPYKRG